MTGFLLNPEKNSGIEYYKSVLSDLIEEDILKHFQIVDDYNAELDEKKIRVFWCHDVPENPETKPFSDKDWVNKFHRIVFTSYWQQQKFEEVYGIPHNINCVVIENAIEPSPEKVLEKAKRKINLLYIGAYWRGFEIVASVFDYFSKEQEDIHLNMFIPNISEIKDNELLDLLKSNDRIHLYEKFSRNDFLKVLKESHIFTLPSNHKQISGRALIEAMSAGCVCVHPNTNNLPEISGSLNVMYQANMEDKHMHANIFAGNLKAAIDLIRDDKEKNMIRFNKLYVDSRYNLDYIKNKWKACMNNLLKEYPYPSTRYFKENIFCYSADKKT